MELTLSKLPWYAQIGAFVLVSAGALFGFWKFYVVDQQADIEARQQRLAALRSDVARGVATARRLPEFQAQVTDLQHRLENLKAVLPEQKDVADILRRVEGLAIQSHLKIQRFQPQPPKQLPIYAELPHKLVAEGTYHDLAEFFDRVSKFHRIINISEVTVKPRQEQRADATIVAEMIATTFVLQESKAAAGTKVPVVGKGAAQ